MKGSGGQMVVDVLVSIAIIAMVAVGVATTSNLFSTTTSDTNAINVFNNVILQIDQMISNEALCRVALGGNPNKTLAPLNPQSLSAGGGAQPIVLYQPQVNPATGKQDTFLDPSQNLYKYFPPPSSSYGGPYPPPGAWTLLSLQLLPLVTPTPKTPISAEIIIQMQAPSAGSNVAPASKQQIRYLSLVLNDAYQITNCFGLSSGTDTTQAPVCANDHQKLVSDGTQLRCRQVSCVCGTQQGVDADGYAICLPGCY